MKDGAAHANTPILACALARCGYTLCTASTGSGQRGRSSSSLQTLAPALTPQSIRQRMRGGGGGLQSRDARFLKGGPQQQQHGSFACEAKCVYARTHARPHARRTQPRGCAPTHACRTAPSSSSRTTRASGCRTPRCPSTWAMATSTETALVGGAPSAHLPCHACEGRTCPAPTLCASFFPAPFLTSLNQIAPG